MSDYLKRFKPEKIPEWGLIEHELTAPDGCKAIWYSTDQPGLFEGQHAKNLMLVIDEAKSVPREIWMAAERLQARLILIMSSTGAAVGPFYECFTTRAAAHSCHKITALESSFVDRAWIEHMRETYGERSDIFKSSVLAEFTSAEEGALISLEAVHRAVHGNIIFQRRPPVAGLDLAASSSGDESVIAVREGNKIVELICWRDSDAMRVCGRCVQELQQRKIPADRVFADAGGLGAGIVSRMREIGFNVNAIQFGGKPLADNHRLGNRMTELWDQMRNMIEDGRLILPDDPDLIGQLTARRVHVTSAGQVKLESKAEMRKRGLRSPDRADAVALSLLEAEAFQPIRLNERTSKLGDYYQDEEGLQNRNLLSVSGNGKFRF